MGWREFFSPAASISGENNFSNGSGPRFSSGDKSKAIAAYDSCILNDYTYVDAYLEKGIILYEQQKYPDALSVFEKARAIANTNADAYFWTGKTYEAMNKKQEAIEFYKKTRGFDESVTEAKERLGKLEGQ